VGVEERINTSLTSPLDSNK